MPDIATPHTTTSGWIEAGAYVVAIGLLSLIYAVGHALGVHPSAFILYAMTASAVGMLAITGPGPDVRRIMLHPASLVVGSTMIVIEICYFLAISQVSPAHGTLIVRISIPLSMLAGAILIGRRPTPVAAAAALVIVAATGYVIATTTPALRVPAAIWGSLTAALMVVRSYATEFHPWNRAARTVQEKLRVTGIVVLVTSIGGVALMASVAATIAVGVLPPLAMVPTLTEFLHVPTLLLGIFGGGIILTVMLYLGFSAIVKIETENLMAMMALSPVTVWAFQSLAVAAGLIAVDSLDLHLVGAMAVLVAAALVICWAGRRSHRTAGHLARGG